MDQLTVNQSGPTLLTEDIDGAVVEPWSTPCAGSLSCAARQHADRIAQRKRFAAEAIGIAAEAKR